MGNFRDYIKQTQGVSNQPQNVFEHASSLLEGESSPNDKKDMLGLVSKRIKLANVGNDILLSLEQDEVKNLVDWCDAGKRDEICRGVFENLYAKWANSLDLTRARDGMERQAQGAIGVNFQNPYQTGGFGEGLPQFQQQDPNNPRNQDPLSQFLNRFGKKR